ncbi:MAG: metal-dependent transcriptional regulator [Clostridia bacterium]|nr:metal-dependent transcriptional regulator [Clostridia bacterium]
MENLTFVMENYLEAIYELSKEKHSARISDIAERLSVSKASASNAMQTLMTKGLVVTEKYREVYLTEEGRKLAEMTSKKHKTIKRFFIEILSIDPTVADSDACAIEHVISNISIRAMERFLEEKRPLS